MKPFVVLLFIAVSMIHAESFPPKGFTEVRREKSPREDFQMIYFRKDPDEILSESQIWIQWSKGKYPVQLLFEYSNDARCIVSDDEQYIAINNHVMAGLGELEIFIRNKEGLFQMKKLNLLEASMKMLKVSGFDHVACIARAWMWDGILLCELRGNQGAIYREQHFTYYAKSNVFSFHVPKPKNRR